MKTIFITGAGAGIGLATARRFAREGWRVGAADRDPQALAALARELGSSCWPLRMDVTDVDSVRRALAEFGMRSNGRLDVLMNNAGVLKVGAFEQISMAEHARIMQINVIGLMQVLHAAFPLLRDTEGAQVINMSSASAIYGTPDFASYSASKHAVRALTEALDLEWEPHSIRVTDLMPPFVNTGMVQANLGASRLFDTLGVDLAAADIAEAAWQLVRKPRVHRPVSWRMRLLWPVSQVAPAALTRGLMRVLRRA